MKTLMAVLWLMMPVALFEAEFGARSALAQGRAQEARTPAAAIRVFSSDAVKEVLDELLPRCEQAIGKSIDMQFNRSAVSRQKIEAGDAFDVAIIQAAMMDDLITKAHVASASRATIGRTGIGIGVRAGTRKADIRTPAALKQVLLNAKSITYAPESVSRMYIDQVYERLGIVKDVAPKIIFQQEAGVPLRSVAEGKAELVVILISEILATPGVELLGPLPAELQNYVAYAAGVSSKSRDATAATAFIRCISQPSAAPIYRSHGLEP